METNSHVDTISASATPLSQFTHGATATTTPEAAIFVPTTTQTPTIEVRTIVTTTMVHNTTIMEMEMVALEKTNTTMLEPTQLVDSHLININLILPFPPNNRCITNQA
jgi:hypothetical protein